MISTDFAPNESWSDALLSSILILNPFIWKDGKALDKLKKQLSLLTANKNVFLFLTGRGALYNLLKSLNLPKNSEIIVQGFTCEAVVVPIIANGLKPVYVDIEPETFSIDDKDLEYKLSGNVKAIILQHTFGLIPKNRKAIINFSKKNKIVVIEDLAHGFDRSIFKENSSDTIKLLSFGRSKALSSVFGGAILTNNNLIVSRLISIKSSLPYPNFLFIFKLLLYKPLVMLIKSTYEIILGKFLHKFFSRINLLVPEITCREKEGKFDDWSNKAYPNVLAILLINQLKKFDAIQTQRLKICKFYKNVLGLKFNVSLPQTRFPLLIDNRDNIIDKAKQENIFLGKWYEQVIAPKDLNLNKAGYKKKSCPVAEDICKKIINLPTNISENEALRVTKILNDITLFY